VRPECYFEYALLRKFDFVLDIEAGAWYSDQVEVVYSYRPSSFTYSQFVHKSGVAFVQVRGGQEGFRWLKNRLLAADRFLPKEKPLPAAYAEELRQTLTNFCTSPQLLDAFYQETKAAAMATIPTDASWSQPTPPLSAVSRETM
jgi:hypothetical protein